MQFLIDGLPSADQNLQVITDPAGLSQTVCQLCGKSFKYGQHTKSHVLNVHVTREEVACGLCEKILKYRDSL